MTDVIKDMRIIMVLISTVVLHLAIAIFFIVHSGSSRTELEETKKSLSFQFKKEMNELEREREQILLSEFGAGKMERIIYDPRLDIRLTLLKLFEAATSSEYLVEVKVDRFTEFEVYINVFNMPEPRTLAKQLKEAFTYIDPGYVFHVIFTDDEDYWIITRKQLERVGNWRRADISRILKYCF